jgi:hypothetical protein
MGTVDAPLAHHCSSFFHFFDISRFLAPFSPFLDPFDMKKFLAGT